MHMGDDLSWVLVVQKLYFNWSNYEFGPNLYQWTDIFNIQIRWRDNIRLVSIFAL